MLTTFSADTPLPPHDVCVVGAGPVGIALALACEERGLDVLLLESGRERVDRAAVASTSGHIVDPTRHAPADIAMCRALGGTSRWWGGRCVPFDDIDFADRPHVPEASWPLRHDTIGPWYARAAEFFGLGSANFTSPIGPWTDLDDVRFDQLERWAPVIDAGTVHRRRLEKSSRITVMLDATVVGMSLSESRDRVRSLTLANLATRREIEPGRVILACGGLETTRLLLVAQQSYPTSFGGRDGRLGRGYMGHLSGKIAELVLTDPSEAEAHDFYVESGAYVRRRFTLAGETQQREGLLNVAFWADNAFFYNADHRNGTLSAVWLALAFAPFGRLLLSEAVRTQHVGPPPRRWGAHIGNVIGTPLSTAANLYVILRDRYLSRPRRPGFLLRNKGGRYALHYLAEHAPRPDSRVTLSDRRDALGMPFLNIDIRYSDFDARSVVLSHEVLDRALRRSGLGRLEFRTADRRAREEDVLRNAGDGYHQCGTTRMAISPAEGVVDTDCRAHGIDNLYIAASSIFPSSSQANPTFLSVALAYRLAAHLASDQRPPAARLAPIAEPGLVS